MDNKEAIRILGLECDEWDISHCTASERREAFEMAITALQELDKNLTKPNNSNDGVKNANANSTNEIKSRVKGLTACRVQEDQASYRQVTGKLDTISRRQAIDAFEDTTFTKKEIFRRLSELPFVQPETCDTCKHGYFGDEQCNDCRVRFTSCYERRTDGSD